MEYVARREPLRHPAVEGLDHRKIKSVAHPVKSEPVSHHRRRHQPGKRADFFFRHSVHPPRRIRRVQMLEMSQPLHLARQIERPKRAGAGYRDFHPFDWSAGLERPADYQQLLALGIERVEISRSKPLGKEFVERAGAEVRARKSMLEQRSPKKLVGGSNRMVLAYPAPEEPGARLAAGEIRQHRKQEPARNQQAADRESV